MEGIDVVDSRVSSSGVSTRAAAKARSTKETTIDVALDLDGDADTSAAGPIVYPHLGAHSLTTRLFFSAVHHR